MDVDLAALVIRLALGPMLIAHGVNKIAGADGLTGTARWFESLGFRAPHAQARIAAGSEIAAGMLMILGAVTPLTCAAFVGLMTVATLTDHRGKGYFVFRGGSEYTVLVAMVAVGLGALGPGHWSLDNAFGLESADPGLRAAAITALGVASGVAFVAAFVWRRHAPSHRAF